MAFSASPIFRTTEPSLTSFGSNSSSSVSSGTSKSAESSSPPFGFSSLPLEIPLPPTLASSIEQMRSNAALSLNERASAIDMPALTARSISASPTEKGASASSFFSTFSAPSPVASVAFGSSAGASSFFSSRSIFSTVSFTAADIISYSCLQVLSLFSTFFSSMACCFGGCVVSVPRGPRPEPRNPLKVRGVVAEAPRLERLLAVP